MLDPNTWPERLWKILEAGVGANQQMADAADRSADSAARQARYLKRLSRDFGRIVYWVTCEGTLHEALLMPRPAPHPQTQGHG